MSKKIPLRFYGRSTIASLTSDVTITVKSLSKNTIKSSVVKMILDTCWFCVKQRLLITGKVKLPKLGDLVVFRDRDGRIGIKFLCDAALITEMYSSLCVKSPSLSAYSDCEE
jgi:hypothetical protein